MDAITRQDVNRLLETHAAPCISMYLPTPGPAAEESLVLWTNSLAEAKRQLLANGYDEDAVKRLLRPAHALTDDRDFWKHRSAGLACFVGPDFMQHYRVDPAFAPRTVVANHFAILPLLPLVTDGHYFLLALSQNRVRLFRGNRQGIVAVELAGVPANIDEALAAHDRDEPLTFHTRPTSGGGWCAIFEGHGVGIDDKKDDLFRYFRQIDHGIHPALRMETAPLIVASVRSLQPIYREANTYAHLLEEGIDGNPDRWSGRELHARAWPLVERILDADLERAIADCRRLAEAGYASADPETVITAAMDGRVETLFVPTDRHLWGRYDASSCKTECHADAVAGDDDLLELAAAHTLRHGRKVRTLAARRIPGGDLTAAIFEHPLPRHGKHRR